MKSNAKTVLMYALGLGLLAVVLYRNWESTPDGPGLSEVLTRPIHFDMLALAAFFGTFASLIIIVRWYMLVRAQGLQFTPGTATRLGLIGLFFNTFLPGSVGGDVIKAAGIARKQSRRTVAVATVIIDRAIGLWSLIWVVAILGGLFWATGNERIVANEKLQRIVTTALAIIGASVITWVLLGFLPEHRAERFAGRLTRLPKVGHSAAEFWRAVWMYRKRGAVVLAALGISLMSHTGFVFMFHFASLTFQTEGGTGSLPEHFLIMPVGMVFQALIPTPGGVGAGEAGFGALYRILGLPAINGVLASLAYRTIMLGLGIVGYVVYLQMKREHTLPGVDETTGEPALSTASQP